MWAKNVFKGREDKGRGGGGMGGHVMQIFGKDSKTET